MNIIGGGNVAFQLARSFFSKGYTISGIYNRTPKKAVQIAKLVDSAGVNSISELSPESIMILAISDDGIEKVGQMIYQEFGSKVNLLHTSGVHDTEILPSQVENKGVLWPVQSITREDHFTFDQIPLCINASNPKFLDTVKSMANDISNCVYHLDGQRKEIAHLAAVFANNFSNHLYHIAEKICDENQIDFEILKPLIINSTQKLTKESPKNLQTGPARRGDFDTIEKHLNLIDSKKLKHLYFLISESIINTYHENS